MNLRNTRYMQYVAAITGTLASGTGALYEAWPSPILPKIASGDSNLGTITHEESSWIVSSLALGTILGAILSGWTVETFGRKGSLFLSGLPLLLPWFVVAFSNSVWIVCIARFIAGIAMANSISAIMLYNGEIAEKEIRGRLCSSFNAMGLTAELVILCIGPYVSYLALTLICSVAPFVFAIVIYFMPESPYYLIKIGKEVEARKDLKRLLRDDIHELEFEQQINEIKSSVNTEMMAKTSLWDYLSAKEYRTSLILSLGIQTLHQLSGFAAISSYMQTIIQSTESIISPEMSSLICGLVQLPAVLITTAIVDKAGRKPLFIISCLGCALALAIEGIYFYLQDIIHADVSNLSWAPATGILLYVIMRPVGIGTLTYILLGELFSTNIKGHAIAVSNLYNNILLFAVAKSFEPVSIAWGMHIMFALFSVVCVLGALFIYFLVPETKGKTFAEIKEKLDTKSKSHL